MYSYPVEGRQGKDEYVLSSLIDLLIYDYLQFIINICRLTALDLISYLAAEDNPKQFLHIQEEEMEQILLNVKEANLKLTLAFGIGIHHAGLQDRDRKTVEELFVNHKIQVSLS